MDDFKGFPSESDRAVPLPEVFFTELLPAIDHLGEMRITLYAFWSINNQVKEPRYLCLSEILKDERLSTLFGGSRGARERNLSDALNRACSRGTLLDVQEDGETYYFLNTARGKAAREGLVKGAWSVSAVGRPAIRLEPERPNIFALYEKNIGPLTPILSETLQEAERTYPLDWIEDAIRIAVTRNVRHWRFVEAVLKSWTEKGRDGTDRKTSQEDRKRDSEGKFADFVKH